MQTEEAKARQLVGAGILGKDKEFYKEAGDAAQWEKPKSMVFEGLYEQGTNKVLTNAEISNTTKGFDDMVARALKYEV